MSFVHMILAHDFSGCACEMVGVRSTGHSYHEVSKLQLNSYFHFCLMIVVFIICLQYCLVGWLGFDTGVYNWWFSCCSWHIPKSGALHLHLLCPPLLTYSHIHHPPTHPWSRNCAEPIFCSCHCPLIFLKWLRHLLYSYSLFCSGKILCTGFNTKA